MTTSARKLTAIAENGQVFTRRSNRTYTHAVYVETTYSDGEVVNSKPRWTGRPDLAEKNLAELAQHAARKEGEEVLLWDMQKCAWVSTGRFYAKARAIAVPVSG